MKQKELEMHLQDVPLLHDPQPKLEQYHTPAPIVADILYTAVFHHDIVDKTVMDLACGTGIFAVGAALLGARQVYGIDLDERCIAIARRYAEQQHLTINFSVQEVQEVSGSYDTVVMNPPFGAQKKNKKADRKFIEKSFAIAKVFYSLHLSSTCPFLETMISSLGGRITLVKSYTFPIKHTFFFHEKPRVFFDVTLLRVSTGQ
jgi:putative methylase